MRIILALILSLFCSVAALADPPSLPLPTVTATKLHVVTSEVRLFSNDLVWGGTNLGAPNNYGIQPGQWVTIDARPWFDPTFATNATGIFLSGILIITSPNAAEDPNLTVTFARPSDPVTTNGSPCGGIDAFGAAYIFQAAIGGVGGVRSTGSAMVPVETGQFKVCYAVSTTGDYPAHASYGINFTPQYWVE
jgi:hypothetical protein